MPNKEKTCKLSGLLCKFGVHDMEYVSCWVDKEGSINIQEYACTRCGKTAWNFAYFNPIMCKTLTRIARMDVSLADEKVECGISNEQETCSAPKKEASKKTAGTGKPGSGKRANKSSAIEA